MNTLMIMHYEMFTKKQKKSKISHIHYVLMEAKDIFDDMHFLFNAENKGKKNANGHYHRQNKNNRMELATPELTLEEY